MKRALAAVGLIALWCWWVRHRPERQPIGGYRCVDCKRAFADLGEAGTMDDADVGQTRSYSRENGGTYIRGGGWMQ